jgi:hypothetical protein
MRKSFASTGLVGRVSPKSNVLKSNMLGDPSMPVVDVCLPGTAVLQLDLFWLGLPAAALRSLRRSPDVLLRSAQLEEPRVQAYLNRVLALPRLRRHAYAPIIAISPPTSRRRRLVRSVRPRRVPPLPPGVWRRASRRAVRCGQPACAGQWQHRYGSGERLCMLR